MFINAYFVLFVMVCFICNIYNDYIKNNERDVVTFVSRSIPFLKKNKNGMTSIYLDNLSSSHVFTNKTSSFEPVASWEDICVSSDVGNFTSVVSSIDPADGSICVASIFEEDNVLGTHIGDCNAYSLKIWLNLE